VINGSFDNQGAWPGLADGWTITSTAAEVDVAPFADRTLGPLGVERFNWSASISGIFVRAWAIFGNPGSTTEDFGAGWLGGQPYLLELTAAISSPAPVSPEVFDWMVGNWIGLWDDLDPGDVETAADTDVDVAGYITLWSEVPSTASASFDGPTAVEIFDNWTALPA
jgi:hypothetical protein